MATKVEEFGIVKIIMKVLKLDDAGKISKFFAAQVKDAKRAITQLEANSKAFTLQFDIDKDSLENALEDAEQVFEQAYENVTPEDVVNNEAITYYSDLYWNRIELARQKVENIKDKLKELRKFYDESIQQNDEQIAKYQERINKIIG